LLRESETDLEAVDGVLAVPDGVRRRMSAPSTILVHGTQRTTSCRWLNRVLAIVPTRTLTISLYFSLLSGWKLKLSLKVAW